MRLNFARLCKGSESFPRSSLKRGVSPGLEVVSDERLQVEDLLSEAKWWAGPRGSGCQQLSGFGAQLVDLLYSHQRLLD